MSHDSDRRTREVLAEIEASQRFGTYSHPGLGKLRKELFGETEVPPCSLRWELIATSVYLSTTPTHWGIHFGPSTSSVLEDGTRIDSPPLEAITQECIEYWQLRMNECQQPTLRALFADLVWEFCQKITGMNPPIEAAWAAIDSYLEAVLTDRLDPPGREDEVISRLLALCVSVGDADRLKSACDQLLEWTGAAESDDAKGWRERDLFPLLLQIPKKKWPRDSLDSLAQRTRQRLEATSLGAGKQWARRALAIPLVDYFWQTGQKEDAHAVLRYYGEAVIVEAEKAKAMMAIGWLEELMKLYRKHELHDDAKDVMRLMASRQPDLPGELVTLKTPFELNKEEINEWLESVMEETLESSILNLVRCFHPRLDNERQELRNLEKQHSLLTLIGASESLVDHEGRAVARIEDEDGRLVRHIAQDMQVSDAFLQFAFPDLFHRFNLTPDVLLEELSKSPVWSRDRMPILERAIRAFIEGDSLVAIHLMIPEIEAAIRNLASGCGVLLQKLHRHGGYVLRNLDDLLREDAVITTLTEDTAVYLRIVLTDQRGWNVRNNVCHGLSPAGSLGASIARRLMLIVFLLGCLREQSPPEEPSVDNGNG